MGHLARFLGIVALIVFVLSVVLEHHEQVMAALAVACVAGIVGCVLGLIWIGTR